MDIKDKMKEIFKDDFQFLHLLELRERIMSESMREKDVVI